MEKSIVKEKILLEQSGIALIHVKSGSIKIRKYILKSGDAIIDDFSRETEITGLEKQNCFSVILFPTGVMHNFDLIKLNSGNEASGFIEKGLKFTSENFRNVSERQVAEYCGVSYSYFSRSFKKTMQMSFSRHINELRINEAKRLLLYTEKTITDIAMELGYSTASHFINKFKQYVGISPKQYRKMKM